MAILKRAGKEGWIKGAVKEEVTEAPYPVTLSIGAVTVPPDAARELARKNEFSLERAEKICDLIAAGATLGVAAAAAGITRETLRDWRDSSPAFNRAIEEAQAQDGLRHIDLMGQAALRGDVKAISSRLNANPLTKEEYGQGKEGSQGGPAIVVQFNWDRDPPKATKVIDITPQDD